MGQQWFVKTSKGQAGPFSSDKLCQLVADGKIKPSSAISPDGKKWVKAESIKGLKFPSATEDPLGLGGAIFGFSETSTLPFVEQREAEYVRRFGPYSQVFHELQPIVPHIDVYVHPPHGDRDFTTLITGGMSDHPMPIPPGPSSPRAELVLYVVEPTEVHVGLLRFLRANTLQAKHMVFVWIDHDEWAAAATNIRSFGTRLLRLHSVDRRIGPRNL